MLEGYKIPNNLVAISATNSSAAALECSRRFNYKLKKYEFGSGELSGVANKILRVPKLSEQITMHGFFSLINRTMIKSSPVFWGNKQVNVFYCLSKPLPMLFFCQFANANLQILIQNCLNVSQDQTTLTEFFEVNQNQNQNHHTQNSLYTGLRNLKSDCSLDGMKKTRGGSETQFHLSFIVGKLTRRLEQDRKPPRNYDRAAFMSYPISSCYKECVSAYLEKHPSIESLLQLKIFHALCETFETNEILFAI